MSFIVDKQEPSQKGKAYCEKVGAFGDSHSEKEVASITSFHLK